MKQSVGIIVYKTLPELNIFLAHPGGNEYNKWAFLKGCMEQGEDKIDTALREFYEESGVSLNEYRDSLVYLGEIRQNREKIVTAYALDITGKMDINPNTCYSNLCDKGWPENDKYAWVDIAKAKEIGNPKHFDFYDKIVELCKDKK